MRLWKWLCGLFLADKDTNQILDLCEHRLVIKPEQPMCKLKLAIQKIFRTFHTSNLQKLARVFNPPNP